MSHRLLAAIALAAAFPAPALAQDRATDDQRRATDEMAAKMSDPQVQQAMGAAVATMSEALLDIPIAPLARAAKAMGETMGGAEMAEDLAEMPEGTTLRDMAGPQAETMPGEMARRLPAMMGAMAGMAGMLEAMRPALEGMAGRMKDAAQGRE